MDVQSCNIHDRLAIMCIGSGKHTYMTFAINSRWNASQAAPPAHLQKTPADYHKLMPLTYPRQSLKKLDEKSHLQYTHLRKLWQSTNEKEQSRA